MNARKVSLSLFVVLSPFAIHLFMLIPAGSANGLWLIVYNMGMMVLLAVALVNIKRDVRETAENNKLVEPLPQQILTLGTLPRGVYRAMGGIVTFRSRHSIYLYDYANNAPVIVSLSISEALDMREKNIKEGDNIQPVFEGIYSTLKKIE